LDDFPRDEYVAADTTIAHVAMVFQWELCIAATQLVVAAIVIRPAILRMQGSVSQNRGSVTVLLFEEALGCLRAYRSRGDVADAALPTGVFIHGDLWFLFTP
jgi:hypothetical protein